MLLSRCPSHASTRPSHTFQVLFQMSALHLFDLLVVAQGVAEVLLVGYVVVWGRPAFLSPSVDAGLGEIVIVVMMHGVY